MSTQDEMAEMVVKLKQLMTSANNDSDFVQPSLLKEVPSFTSSDSVPMTRGNERAQLGRRAY
jgi:hypothetical protein